VPVVLLDYDRRETIAPALEGVDRLFILTAYTERRPRGRGVIRHYVGHARLSWIDAEDIAEVAAAVLRDPGTHKGQTYRLGYDAKTYDEIAKIFTQVIGQPFSYEPRPPREFLDKVLSAGGEPAYMDCVYDSYSRLSGEGIPGSDETFDNFTRITGRQPNTLADFACKHASRFKY
jgi:NAD(P)H dehydrogenase (quinone)